MKTTLFLLVTFLANLAFSANLCQQNAAQGIRMKYKASFAVEADGSQRTFDVIDCRIAPNNKVIICDAFATNGNDAGDMSFLAILSVDCSRIIDARLIGSNNSTKTAYHPAAAQQ